MAYVRTHKHVRRNHVIREHSPTVQHNFQVLMAFMLADGELSGITHIHFAHDDWCDIFVGGFCNCYPDFEIDPVGGRGLDDQAQD